MYALKLNVMCVCVCAQNDFLGFSLNVTETSSAFIFADNCYETYIPMLYLYVIAYICT